MKVTYSRKHSPYWEVTADDGRWWSVAYNKDTCTYLITNSTGRVLSQRAITGHNVLTAVHNYERST